MVSLKLEKRISKARARYLQDMFLPKISPRPYKKRENNLDTLGAKLQKLTSSESCKGIQMSETTINLLGYKEQKIFKSICDGFGNSSNATIKINIMQEPMEQFN